MNVKSKDLNLLVLFKLIYEEKNLTKVGELLNLSQPALSHRLKRLREEFNDELFTKSARILIPTVEAKKLYPKVSTIIDELNSFYQDQESHDFSTATEIIKIFTTDIMESLISQELLKRIKAKAPNVKIAFQNTNGQLPSKELEYGTCDIAIAGYFKNLPMACYKRDLYQDYFVVLTDKNNSIIKKNLTLKCYLKAEHFITTLSGDLNGVIDKELKKKNLKRNVVCGFSNFISPISSLENTDYMLTCLNSMANYSMKKFNFLNKYECPVQTNKITKIQVWHQRTHSDPLRSWIRNEIHQILNP